MCKTWSCCSTSMISTARKKGDFCSFPVHLILETFMRFMVAGSADVGTINCVISIGTSLPWWILRRISKCLSFIDMHVLSGQVVSETIQSGAEIVSSSHCTHRRRYCSVPPLIRDRGIVSGLGRLSLAIRTKSDIGTERLSFESGPQSRQDPCPTSHDLVEFMRWIALWRFWRKGLRGD